MASSREYLDFVLEQLNGLDGVTARGMMGEYILYYQGKVVGGIYDDRFLVKDTAAARRLMPEAPLETPYEGAKDMLLADVDDRELLERLIPAMAEELPAPKKKKA
jgi:TfoX/Sxy family transcriptional regulator of competence genes